MQIYNTLNRKKQEFQPVKNGQVKLYSCGPTVYARAHIGNLRAYIFADILQRSLKYLENYKIIWVINITDIDDKIIHKLQKTKTKSNNLNTELIELTDKYTLLFMQDLSKVGIATKDISFTPRATDYIPEIQQLITKLLNKDMAYIKNGSIYFDINNYILSGKKYGQLSRLGENKKTRLTDDQDQKRGIADFALWKAKKKNEPSWDFVIDKNNYVGRPGWHIECTVMSSDLLGVPFDIHTGGVDHIFPHHENEIAQANGKLANYFIHNEFLQVGEGKMSKSLGNTISLDTIQDPIVFRFICLSVQYRQEMRFTDEILHSFESRIKKLRNYCSQMIYNLEDEEDEELNIYWIKFENALLDDLKTPEALAALSELANTCSLSITSLRIVKQMDNILNLKLIPEFLAFTTKEKRLIKKRSYYKNKKEFEKADQIRTQLQEIGIEIKDMKNKTLAWRSTVPTSRKT